MLSLQKKVGPVDLFFQVLSLWPLPAQRSRPGRSAGAGNVETGPDEPDPGRHIRPRRSPGGMGGASTNLRSSSGSFGRPNSDTQKGSRPFARPGITKRIMFRLNEYDTSYAAPGRRSRPTEAPGPQDQRRRAESSKFLRDGAGGARNGETDGGEKWIEEGPRVQDRAPIFVVIRLTPISGPQF